jgi:hypothetical protein
MDLTHFDVSCPLGSLAAYERDKGEFIVSRYDDQGRVEVLEGWAMPTSGARTKEESAFQKDLRELAADSKGLDASHIIAYSLGGRGKENLILVPEKVNQSFLRALEKDLSFFAEKSPDDRGLYIRAELTWGESKYVPESLHYEAYLPKSDSMVKVHDSWQKTNWSNEEKTLKQILDNSNYSQNTRQWVCETPDNGYSH